MIRKQKIEDSPEFRYFEEHFDEMMEEMEKDSESQSFEIPEEWDRSFRKTIEETVEREEKKKSRKEKLLRWGSRAVAAAAGVALVMFIGMNFSAVQVQGEGLLDVFQKMFEMNDETHVVYGTDKKIGEITPEEQMDDIIFAGDTLDEIYDEARDELKMPMFYFVDIFDSYTVETAKYNKTYRALSIQLDTPDGYVFISQKQLFDEGGSGVVADEEKCSEVYNAELNQNISIYKGIQDDFLVFSVKVNQTVFAFNGEISIERCRKIAESLYFK